MIFAQSEFIREARYHLPRKDSLYGFDTGFSAGGKYDYYRDSTSNLNLMMNSLVQKGNKNRTDTLKQSLVLTQLSTLCVKRIHSIMPVKTKRKNSLEKRIRRIFFGSSCNFGLIETVAFEIPLVKKTTKHFHYNKKGAAGGFNLYEGKSKPLKTKENPEPEETPLEFYTYDEIQQLIKKQFTRKKVYRHLAEKQVSAFGYYIELDKTTVYRNKIPKLKVLIILGEKRFSYKQRRKFASTPLSDLSK
ncbi:hypothetical protein D3C86_1414360 [compost metagenome]